tara:strand:- start:319 stop:759 length:441 start_codon:yes stop_codon:yes gene_type:complete
MGINFYSKKIVKLIGIFLILSNPLLEINAINKQVKAQENSIAASEQDLFLYRQMGASYLCISTNAQIDFKKGLAVASATFANVITGKHGGVIKGLGDKKIEQKRLYKSGSFQIVGSALNICPESIPQDIKNEYEKSLKEFIKKNKK